MNAEQSTKQKEQRARDIASLVKLWEAGMPTIEPPDEKQFELWFQIHRGDFGTLAFGLEQCARLYIQRRGHMDYDHCIKHSSKVMNRYSRDRARRNQPIEHWPLNYLTKEWADKLGLPPGLGLTESMYWRCAARVRAIDGGRIQRPTQTTAVPDKKAA